MITEISLSCGHVVTSPPYDRIQTVGKQTLCWEYGCLQFREVINIYDRREEADGFTPKRQDAG